jgi:hypothetical protein
MHEYRSEFIKFSIASPADPSKQTQVLVSLAHVVRIVPCYFLESGGKRMVTTVEVDDGTARQQGLKRTFTVHDDIGGLYDSASASRAGRALLERLWEESA